MGKQNSSGLSLSHRPWSIAFKGMSNAQIPELLCLYFDYLFLFLKEIRHKLFAKMKFTSIQYFVSGVGKCTHAIHFNILHRCLPARIISKCNRIDVLV